MLRELKIRNFAIIESVDIYFGPGLNVLTGETGAGKSILLDALNIALGGKTDREVVRTGSQEAWVEAVFEASKEATDLAGQWGIDVGSGDALALRRVIQGNGRSRAYLNCAMVAANLLRQISLLLLDFGRQHEQSTLMSPEKHRELLDRYGNAQKESEAVAKLHGKVLALLREKEQLTEDRHARTEKLEFLHFQKAAISEVDPQPGEEEELERELEKLNNTEKCRHLAQRIEHALYQGDEAVRDRLSSAIAVLEELSSTDNSVEHVLADLRNALIAIEEAARSMQLYQKGLRSDKDKIRELEERMDEVIKLQQRYGGSFAGVAKRLSEIEKEIVELQRQEKRMAQVGDLTAEAQARLCKAAIVLSEKRRKTASELAPQVAREIAGLAMEHGRFEVEFTPVAVEANSIFCKEEHRPIAPWGMENVHFLFSANPGEELRPLERVASGGELSRIMLALKKVMVGAIPVDTFVVDEIDSGVAGAAAATVAEKLREIVSGNASQIISISHTPQIAAQADYHFYVEKKTSDGRTVAQVSLIDEDKRIAEISRMLSGDCSSEQALALAREMVRGSRRP